MAREEIDIHVGNRGGHGHGGRVHKRHAPFIGHWQVSGLLVPFAGTVAFMVSEGFTSWFGVQRITFPWGGHWDIRVGLFMHSIGILIAGLTILSAVGLIAIAEKVGREVAKRVPFVVRHVQATIALCALLIWGTTAWGWSPAWVTTHVFASAFIAISWNMYRIDAFRAWAKGDKDKDGDDDKPSKWEAFIGLTESEPDMSTVEQTPNSTSIEIQHKGGETLGQLQNAAPRIGSLANAYTVRAIQAGGMGRSKLTVIKNNPLEGTWRTWPGLSHPGGSFGDGIRTAHYDDGRDQFFYFAPLQKGTMRKTARGRTSIGRQGTTGSGKSGDSNIEQAEVFSRRDVLGAIVDTDKFMQNAGWCKDFLTLAADDSTKAIAVQKAVKAMTKKRQARLAKYGFREWGPEAYDHPQCRCAAFYLFYDEADSVLGELARWLGAKAAAAGVFLSATLPSADHESLPPRLRRSIGAWKCFGCGDEYSASFVLGKKILKASGVDPGEWKAKYPGAHLLADAIGVDPDLYPMICRTFAAEHDDLRAADLEAREMFGGEVFLHPEDEDALGPALEIAHPRFLPMDGDAEDITAEDLRMVQENVERERVRLRTERPIAQPAQAPAARPAYVEGEAVPVPASVAQARMTQADVDEALDLIVERLQSRGEAITQESIRRTARLLYQEAQEADDVPDDAERRAQYEREGASERDAEEASQREPALGVPDMDDPEREQYEAWRERRDLERQQEEDEETVDSPNGVRERYTSDAMQDADPELRAQVAAVDPYNNRIASCGPNVGAFDMNDGLHPATSEKNAVEVLDRALVALAQEGHNTVTNAMILDKIRDLGGAWDPWAVSKRMAALDKGESIPPEGVSVRQKRADDDENKRLRGKWEVIWEANTRTPAGVVSVDTA